MSTLKAVTGRCLDRRVCSGLGWDLRSGRGFGAVVCRGVPVGPDGEDVVGREGCPGHEFVPPRFAGDRASGVGAQRR